MMLLRLRQAIASALFLQQYFFACDGVDLAAEREEQFTEVKCLAVVKKVQESGKYTEQSILPICSEEMRSPKCDFFAEALSLASSHQDFNASRFCESMQEARFCSGVMERLLVSLPISDLAYGECLRAEPVKRHNYCRKFKKMLGYAVENDDLDTMRACYMIEAYTDLSNSSELEASSESPKARIIATGSNELQDVGSGNATQHNRVGNSDIVLRPKPFDTFGKGNGTLSSEQPTSKTKASKPGTIITEPVPLIALGKHVRKATIQVVAGKPKVGLTQANKLRRKARPQKNEKAGAPGKQLKEETPKKDYSGFLAKFVQ